MHEFSKSCLSFERKGVSDYQYPPEYRTPRPVNYPKTLNCKRTTPWEVISEPLCQILNKTCKKNSLRISTFFAYDYFDLPITLLCTPLPVPTHESIKIYVQIWKIFHQYRFYFFYWLHPSPLPPREPVPCESTKHGKFWACWLNFFSKHQCLI